jgi:hypothetical protein
MAHTKTLMINEAILRSLVPEVNNSIDSKLIVKNIEMQQEKVIRPLLGYDFYDEILTQILNDKLTVENKLLLDEYLTMILSLATYKRLLWSASYQLENNGLRSKTSDNSDAVNRNEIAFVANQVQSDIDHFTGEFKRYICDNQSDYPTYNSDSEGRTAGNRNNSLGFGISKI